MPYKQFYLIPIVRVNDERGFKYMQTHERPSGLQNYSGMDFGNEDQGLVSLNAELVDHTILALNKDVFQFPEDLSINVKPNELVKLKKQLNIRNFCCKWILPNKSYTGVIRNIAKQCMVNQRFQGRFNSNLLENKTLKCKCCDLTKIEQEELSLICEEVGITQTKEPTLEIQLTKLMEAIPSTDKYGKKIMCHGIEL